MMRNRRIRVAKFLELTVPLFALIGMSILSWKVSWYGGKRESLAAKFESQFINLSLSNIEYDFPKNSPVVAVSLSDSDLQTLPIVYSSGLVDSSWASYARVIDLALKRGSSLVFVNWMGFGFAESPLQRMEFAEFLRANDPDRRVTFAMPLIKTLQLEEIFKRENRIFDTGDCFYEINLFCSFNPTNLSSWIITKIAQDFSQGIYSSGDQKAVEKYFSTNLPHIYPSYLVNIPDPESMKEWSFSDFVRPDVTLPENAIVFIGNSLSQRQEFANNREAIQRARYSRSRIDRTSLEDGVPYHKFWASLSQMFLDNRLIAVADFSTSTVLACVSALLAVAVMIAFGRIFAFIFYLFLVFFYLVMNILFVKYLGVYIPCYTVLFWTLVTLVSAGFVEMTRHSFVKERNRQAEKQIKESLQLKSNFISLISHNLNTPIAKAKGLLDLLQSSSPESAFGILQRELVSCYTLLQLIIKSALSLIALRDDQGTQRQYSISSNWSDFTGKLFELLKQSSSDLGYESEMRGERGSAASNDSILQYPDERILSYLIVMNAILIRTRGISVKKVISTVSLNCDRDLATSLSIDLEYLLVPSDSKNENMNEGTSSFLTKLFDGLKASYLAKFSGSSEHTIRKADCVKWNLDFRFNHEAKIDGSISPV